MDVEKVYTKIDTALCLDFYSHNRHSIRGLSVIAILNQRDEKNSQKMCIIMK